MGKWQLELCSRKKKKVKLLRVVIQKIENTSNELWYLSNNISRQTAQHISGSYYLHTDKILQKNRKVREITDWSVGKLRWSIEGLELLGWKTKLFLISGLSS